MRVLSADEMRAFDRLAIDELGIPALVLMENAAIGVADALGERFAEAERIAIFCGPGNNGGDGLALARHLLTRGYGLAVFLVAPAGKLSADAEAQLAICRRLGVSVTDVREPAAVGPALEAARASDLVVDALFGTGLGRPLEGLWHDLVVGLNALPMPRLSVDVPSGIDASSAAEPGLAVRADLTVTFAAPKIALVLPPACDWAGELAVTDLGVPLDGIAEGSPQIDLLTRDDVAALLPPRPAGGHKGDFGHVLLVAGGPGKSGAAILAGRGAVHAGAGLVTIATFEGTLPLVAAGCVESMTVPLPAGPAGLDSSALAAAVAAAQGKSALAVGPGLGTDKSTGAVVRALASKVALPLVLDADGLNAFAGRAHELRLRPAPTLLTPHPGEAARLLGVPVGEILADRVRAVRHLAEQTGCWVVLKGRRSLIATRAQDVAIVPTGNAVLGSGGTGDVLTGILAGLLAQGLEVFAAAQVGAYLHGLAGDLWVEAHGARGFAAGDLIGMLPAAFAALDDDVAGAGPLTEGHDWRSWRS